MNKTLSVLAFRMAVLSFENLGGDTCSVLNKINIGQAKIINPLDRIPIAKEHEFWKIARKSDPTPHLTLKMAAHVPFGTFPLLEYIGASSQNVYQALVFFVRFAQTVYGDWHPLLNENETTIEFTLGTDGDAEQYGDTNEFGLAVMVKRLREFAQSEVPLLRVHFRHGPKGKKSEYQNFFKAKVLFNQREDSLFFAKEIKKIRCKNSDRFMLGSLLNLAEKIFSRLSGTQETEETGLIKSVSEAVKRRLPEGEPKIQTVASEVAMSTRTLQRKLEAEGTSLSQIVARVRQDRASELLLNAKTTNEEVALTLGYSTLSAFNRAFKQWHKMTPSQYRKLRAKS